MAESTTKSIKTEVVASVLTATLIAVGGAIWAMAPNLWNWLAQSLASAFAYLEAPTSVPTWWLYVLYIAAAAWVIRLVLATRERMAKSSEPTYTHYREDEFLGAIWRWRYGYSGPIDTWAYCPSCDTTLVYSIEYFYGEPQISLHCETCDRQVLTQPGGREGLIGRIHRQIDRKVRSGEWRNSLVQQEKTLA